MDIIKLPDGQQAPDEADCISIERQTDGSYELTGTALIACGDSDEVESIALVGLPLFDSYEAAEDAGFAWAAQQCVAQLYVARVAFDIPPDR